MLNFISRLEPQINICIYILTQIQVAQHKTHTQRNPVIIIHAVMCVYVCGGCYSCPLKFSKEQQPPPSPKRATGANGFKQYLIISVIQRQLRLNYHTRIECGGFFWTWPSIRQRPTSWQTYSRRTHTYVRFVYNNFLLYPFSLVFSLLLYHFVRSQRVFVYMLCKQTERARERNRGTEEK